MEFACIELCMPVYAINKCEFDLLSYLSLGTLKPLQIVYDLKIILLCQGLFVNLFNIHVHLHCYGMILVKQWSDW